MLFLSLFILLAGIGYRFELSHEARVSTPQSDFSVPLFRNKISAKANVATCRVGLSNSQNKSGFARFVSIELAPSFFMETHAALDISFYPISQM